MKKDFLNILEVSDIGQAMKSFERHFEIPRKISETVQNVISDIKKNGLSALLSYSNKFDATSFRSLEELKVTEHEIECGHKEIRDKYPDLVRAIDISIENITSYHNRQASHESSSWMEESFKGKKTGQVVRALHRVCAYVPGGRYVYPSSVIMNIIPAKVAGVKEIAVCSPPLKDGTLNDLLLYLFKKLEIAEAYKIGGIQAIALMAYGLDGVKKVDKIVGPGNIYVTAAKKQVFGAVGIDSLAGPSEIVVLADSSADPRYIAADLISQAEHDPFALSVLITTDRFVAQKTIDETYSLLDEIKKEYGDRFNEDVSVESLSNNCRIIFCPDINLLLEISNEIAGEHLEVMMERPEEILEGIKNAGSIFLGDFSPVAVGDYIGGTNHVIPTSRSALFSSPLGVNDFIKRSGLTYYGKSALKKEREALETLADYENLVAHKKSVEVRFEERKKDD
jgi:histidinol dehydrogenase